MTTDERLESTIKTIVEVSNNHQGSKPSPEFRDVINDLVALEGISGTQMRSQVTMALKDIHSVDGAGTVALWLDARNQVELIQRCASILNTTEHPRD